MKFETDWTCPNCGELRLISQPLYKTKGIQCRKCQRYWHVSIQIETRTIPFLERVCEHGKDYETVTGSVQSR